LLGFASNKNGGRYNHRLREHVAALAANLHINSKKNANISENRCRDSRPSAKRAGSLQVRISDFEVFERSINLIGSLKL